MSQTALSTLTFRLLPAAEYYDDLLVRLARAKRRIVIAAMEIIHGPRTGVLLAEVEAALRRGVEVHLLADTHYTRISARRIEGGLLGIVGLAGREAAHRNDEALADLERQGARIGSAGTVHRLNPFKGRFHGKFTVVDDYVYTFGGVNFKDDAFGVTDLMLAAENQSLADHLVRLAIAIADDEVGDTDWEIQLSDTSTLLFDVGRPGQSVIYDQACQLATEAEQIYYVSQMSPNGNLADIMTAKRYEAFYNTARRMGIPEGLDTFRSEHAYGMRNSYIHEIFIHAKFILFILRDGRKVLLTGSNNYWDRGISYGTQEIALLSTDPELWDEFYAFLQTQIKLETPDLEPEPELLDKAA